MLGVEEWHAMQPGRFSMTAQSFGAYQKFVEKACLHMTCTQEDQVIIQRGKDAYESYIRSLQNSPR